jgi:hypothetical protein
MTHVSLTDAKSLSNWLKEIYNLSYKDFEKVSLRELAALGMEMLNGGSHERSHENANARHHGRAKKNV